MFDGIRSHAEIAEQFQNETGHWNSEEDVKELAGYSAGETNCFIRLRWSRTSPCNRNCVRPEETKQVSGQGFLRHHIKVWENADGYITWLYPKVGFLFTPWFVWTSIGMFG